MLHNNLLLECTYCNHTVCEIISCHVFFTIVNSVYRLEAKMEAAEMSPQRKLDQILFNRAKWTDLRLRSIGL